MTTHTVYTQPRVAPGTASPPGRESNFERVKALAAYYEGIGATVQRRLGGRVCKPLVSLTDGRWFSSVSDAAKLLNANTQAVRAAMKSGRPVKGHRLRYTGAA
jgi:hypothetical protein